MILMKRVMLGLGRNIV